MLKYRYVMVAIGIFAALALSAACEFSSSVAGPDKERSVIFVGKVIQGGSRAPLADVTVIDLATGNVAHTGESGVFMFGPGNQVQSLDEMVALRFEKKGYRTQRFDLNTQKATYFELMKDPFLLELE